MKRLASKATLMMKDHVFGHETTLSVPGSPDHSRAARLKEEKERKKEKAEDDPKGPEEHSLAKNKHKILKCGQKRTLLGGTKERKARKDCQKAMMAFRRVVFADQRDKSAGKDLHHNKGRGKDQKGKGEEGTLPQSGFSASDTPSEERYVRHGIR